MNLLFPGRHQLLTQFQFQYLSKLINTDLSAVTDINGNSLKTKERISSIIFAVTSANHSNTRRNPLPFYQRAISIQEFAKELSVPCFIYGIDDIGQSKNFASYTIKRINHESEGILNLNPHNTLVMCSTPVLEMYEQLGYAILPAELVDRKTWKHNQALPWDLVEKIAAHKKWDQNKDIISCIHSGSLKIWQQYQLGNKVRVLFNDKMISEDGDITTTRDYNTYVRQMDEIAELKYNETSNYIRKGRIGDIGCAVGSWVKLACKDERFRESDFYGIEVARHLFDICQQRKHNGEFDNPFVFFSQRNAVTGLVFENNSMNTIHTSSLTHEIESYGSREELLKFIRNRFQELAPGGVWVNRDVVGPENKQEMVLMKLNKSDGRNELSNIEFSSREELATYLRSLSTYGRFLQFAQDFRKKENYRLDFEIVKEANQDFIHLKLQDACEFMSRKDYVDNWESEMHETFCFWDFEEWKTHLVAEGFTIAPESKTYTNQWIVENRLMGKVELFKKEGEASVRMDYPVTNMILMGERV